MNIHRWMALPQTRQDAWWLWTGLQAEIRLQCEMLLDSDSFESSLPPLNPGEVLSYAQPWHERIMLAFRCAGGDYDMDVIFDPDLLSVRFAVPSDPHGYELLIVRRRKESLLMDCDGFLLTTDEAAKHIVRTLLVGYQPASSTVAASSWPLSCS